MENRHTATSWSINILSHKIKKPKKDNRAPIRRLISFEYALSLLSKEKSKRTKLEIRSLTHFFSEHFDYFKKIKSSGELQKLEKIVSVLNLETFRPNKFIIRFGEEGDKFYILLTGKVNVYKPIYIQKEMMVKEYVELMRELKFIENDEMKFSRIKEKNAHHNLDLEIYFNMEPNSGYFLNRKLNFFIEKDQILGEFGQGFAFGEIALIKRCTRNATIKAQTNCCLVSINKGDYNRMIREVEEKRLEREFEDFKRDYPLFQSWTNNQMIRLFNCFSKKTVMQGEYLYKQNEESDNIYIINSGSFEIYSMVSYGWINEFFKYIVSAKNNIVHLLAKQNKQFKETELREFFDLIAENPEPSPCLYDPLKVSKIITSTKQRENLVNIKLDEEDVNDPFNLFKILIRIVDYKDVIGFEDALELKNRFCFVKCISPHGEVQQISLYDFFRLLNLNPEKSGNKILMDLIAKKKSILFSKLITAAKKKGKQIELLFDYKYDKLIEDGKEKDLNASLLAEKIRDKENIDLTANSRERQICSYNHKKFNSTYSSHHKNLPFGKINTNFSFHYSMNKIKKSKNEKMPYNLKGNQITLKLPSLTQINNLTRKTSMKSAIPLFEKVDHSGLGHKKKRSSILTQSNNMTKCTHFYSNSRKLNSFDGENGGNLKSSFGYMKKNYKEENLHLTGDSGNLIRIKKNVHNRNFTEPNKRAKNEKKDESSIDIKEIAINKKVFLLKNYQTFFNEQINKTNNDSLRENKGKRRNISIIE